MSTSLLVGAIFLMSFATMSQAASVVKLTDGTEVGGKLTLSPTAIHVEGSSGVDINLSDVLEARFTDAPFHLDYFSSAGSPSDLPSGWKSQDVGQSVQSGDLAYAKGQFTLTNGQWDPPPNTQDQTDHDYVTGIPWTGNGQWTVRLKDVTNPNGPVHGGLMLRDSLDPFAAVTGMAGWDANNIVIFARNATHGTWANIVAIDAYPVWSRLTRQGPSVTFELSPDGEKWTLIGLSTQTFAETCWAGFFVETHHGPNTQKIELDQALFTPAPGAMPTQTVPTGLLLCSGSFVSGYYNPIDFNGPDPTGYFSRNDKDTRIPIVASKASAAVYHPVTRKQLADVSSQVGVILKNGDFMDGNFEAINGGGVRLNSILLGTATYDRDQVCACSLNPVKPLPADYEIRLKDGSSILASTFDLKDGQLAIAEVSGITFNASPDEIAQFRAGPNRVQNLLAVPWKPAAGKSAVQCWTGPSQEQIMAVPAGTQVDFPLAGKFRAVALRIGFSPNSPTNSQATIRVLSDGKEIATTPAFKAGDQPRFMEVTLQAPHTVSLVADSATPGARILFVDPVAIRDNGAATP